MGTRRPSATSALAVGLWAATVAGFSYTVVLEAQARDAGVSTGDAADAVIFGGALLCAATVGLIVAVRQPRHPVGWLFIGLGLALSVGGAGDAHGLVHVVARDEDGASAVVPLVVGQASFIAWFGILGAILQLTPTGRPLGPRWRLALQAGTWASIAALVAKTIQVADFDPPYDGVANPWAVPGIAGLVDAVAALGIGVSMLALVVAGASLVVRFRRARGDEQRQLRWMALVVVPLPVLVVSAYAAATLDAPLLRTLATGGFVAVVPIAAGLSVLRFRLYEVDRILSRTAAYALSSAGLAAIFAAVVAAVGRTLASFVDATTIPAVVATIVTIAAAAPLHRTLQDLLDRRFDRRRYDAHRLVRAHLGASHPDRTLEQTMADALHDPGLQVAYWLPGEQRWVDAGGCDTAIEEVGVDISRHGAPVARIHIGDGVDRRLVAELATEAVAELDNTRLRAELASQLEEVRRSRTRIVAAQAAERHRIERNLHDGAQQRLLGLAMQLRAGPSPGADGATALVELAIDELGAAVRELRELANGLRPSALADGGLALALDDLAGRVGLNVDLAVEPVTLDPLAEEALWFVACEAIANTVKHADARCLQIALRADDGLVRLTCADDGGGGADSGGGGLVGLADRVAAVGGAFSICSPLGGGTVIEAAVPCAS